MAIAEFMPHGRMTEAAYKAEREALRATYGDTAVERTGLFDQELARLFYRSGWTQEQLATAEGKSQFWVSKRVLFGKFLAFISTGYIPRTCTERRFRSYWERTDNAETNERVRFIAVQKLMADELTLSKDHAPKRDVAEAILAAFGDGEWHRLSTIIARVQADEADVLAVLTQMLVRGTYHTFCERRKSGTSWSYRIVRGRGRKVDVEVLVQELSPIVQALKVEGRKHPARYAPATIARLAHQLEAILERLTHEALQSSSNTKKEHDDDGSIPTLEI